MQPLGGGSGGVTRKSSIEIKPHLRSQQTATTINGVDERKRGGSAGALAHHHSEQDKRQASDKASKDRDHPTNKLHHTPSLPPSGSSKGISPLATKSSSGPTWKSDSSNATPTTTVPNATPAAATTSVTSRIPTTSSVSSTATPSTTSSSTTSSSSIPPTTTGARNEPCAKPIPGTTLRCLEDPTFMFDPPKGTQSPPPPGGVRRFSSSSSVSSSVPPVSAAGSQSSVAGSGAVRHIPSHIIPSAHSKPAPGTIPPRSNIRILEAPDTATLHKQSSPLPSSSSSTESSSASAPAPVPSSSSAIISSSSIDFVPPAPVASTKRQGVGAYHVSETPPPHAKRTTYRVLDAPDDTMYGTVPPPGGRSRASEVLDKARNRFDKFWGKTKEDEK